MRIAVTGGTGFVGSDHAFAVQPPAVVYVVLSILAGAAGAFISLEAYFFGVALAAVAGLLLYREARRHRWFALGGFGLGMGLTAAAFLSPALTNRDPAVMYDPSTIPTFWAAVLVALCGVVVLVAATIAHPPRLATFVKMPSNGDASVELNAKTACAKPSSLAPISRKTKSNSTSRSTIPTIAQTTLTSTRRTAPAAVMPARRIPRAAFRTPDRGPGPEL